MGEKRALRAGLELPGDAGTKGTPALGESRAFPGSHPSPSPGPGRGGAESGVCEPGLHLVTYQTEGLRLGSCLSPEFHIIFTLEVLSIQSPSIYGKWHWSPIYVITTNFPF